MTLTVLVQAGLATAALLLATYCAVLARRLRRLNDLETGLGGAIAVMSAETARLQAAIVAAQREATVATQRLAAEVERARQERALWAVQTRFADTAEAAPRPRLRRRSGNEVGHG